MAYEKSDVVDFEFTGSQQFGIGADNHARPIARIQSRPRISGKFLTLDGQKFWIRGVTYGTFDDANPAPGFPTRDRVEADFREMAAAGMNAVRVYSAPPRWLLDRAAANGLRVMVGLPWEQHVAFLDDAALASKVIRRVAEAARKCADHPGLLCFAIGNEIPASVVRWYGPKRIVSFLRRLTEAVRREDPGALVTYVNFPTTEYLELPFVDFLCFNVYLEEREKLRRYLARLQNLAGERPLVMAEIGLDSRRNGEQAQADALRWQIATCFEAGVAGAFVFAWTDEWHRGGQAIEDWDFGLTTRDRRAKAALGAVTAAFRSVPFPADMQWPRISVVVCSFNGSPTIEETLKALALLDYPDYEVIVVNDGSTDATPEIARRFDVRLISTENRGLSAARNTGMEAATGEIVAYIDDDAYPDPHWLQFLAAAFLRSTHAAIGGPNVAPYTDSLTAECVANAPGGPLHVLLDDELAEHIPGCNMAFRKDRLMAVGAFNPKFRVAGDDVDVCWKLQQAGETIGFCAAALVWHHRRPSISRYLKQQQGYARAESLLAETWPKKYNVAGHLSWHGRIYGRGLLQPLTLSQRIYHGPFGCAPFQSIYEPAPGLFTSLPLMPEWCVLIVSAAWLTLLGLAWSPLLWFGPLVLAGVALTFIQAIRGGLAADFTGRRLRRGVALRLRTIVALLHLLQPLARLRGRVQHGIGPWRLPPRTGPNDAGSTRAYWSETWRPAEDRLSALVASVEGTTPVVLGDDFASWDFAVRGGMFGVVRVQTMIEEHGAGRQLLRLRTRLFTPTPVAVLILASALGAVAAGMDGAWLAAAALGCVGAAGLHLTSVSIGSARRTLDDALAHYADSNGLTPMRPRARSHA